MSFSGEKRSITQGGWGSATETLRVAMVCTLCVLMVDQPMLGSTGPRRGPTAGAAQTKGEGRVLHALDRLTFGPRPGDVAGGGYNLGWISSTHAEYLKMGGIDGFVGDGTIRASSERALDAFYSFNFHQGLWLAGDYQRITNPGFNTDRGPVNILSVKIHGEF